MSDADDMPPANWVDSQGHRYWVDEKNPDGTAYALDGDNKGQWVEFGGPSVRRLYRWDDKDAFIWLSDLKVRLDRGEEPTEADKQRMSEMVESLMPLIDMLKEFVTELIATISQQLMDIWMAIPKDVRDALQEAARVSSVGGVNAEIRRELHDKGIPLPASPMMTNNFVVDPGAAVVRGEMINMQFPLPIGTDQVAREMGRSDFLRGSGGAIRG